MKNYSQTDPRNQTQKIRIRLTTLITELRQHVEEVDDLQAQALMETSAEVLEGLKNAYLHFEQKNEEAWQ